VAAVAADVVAADAAAVADAAAAGGDKEDRDMPTRLKAITHCVAAVLSLSSPALAEQRKFVRPEEAVAALVDAAHADDKATIVAILGPGSEEVVSSGDPVEDQAARTRVVAAAKQRTRLETLPTGQVIAHLGKDDWPLPIPLVKDGNEWRFDTAAGREEIINRRIGRNELKAIAAAHAYVDAQRLYAKRQGGYAQKIRSDAGARDGLYWDDPSGKQPSPLGPLFAEASAEGYGKQEAGAAPQPYHGYFYRILTEQGANAPGGARSYVKDGKMTGGFALVAYPAEHGNSGVMTFVVGPQGIVYQKDLGAKTADVAQSMTAYDPDASWLPVRADGSGAS
jgi:hypothetical protein